MSSFVLDVPESVTLRSAPQFSGALMDAFAANADVQLNLSPLAEFDLSFLQILEAARIQRSQDGGVFRLAQPANDAMVAMLNRAGFLGDPTLADIDFWFHGELPQ